MDWIISWMVGAEIAVDIFEAAFLFLWLDRFMERRFGSDSLYKAMVVFLCVEIVCVDRIFQTLALGMAVLSVSALIWSFLVYEGKTSFKLCLIILFYTVIATTGFLTYGLTAAFITDPKMMQEATIHRFAGIVISKLLAFFCIMFVFQTFEPTGRKKYSLTAWQWLALSVIAFTSIAVIVLIFRYNDYLPAGALETRLGILATIGIMLVNGITFFLFHSLQQQSEEQHKKDLLLQLNELLQQYYANLEQVITTTRRFWHDTGNHLQILQALMKTDRAEHTDHAEQYLQNLTDALYANMLPVNSGHPIIDAVLNQKYLMALAKEIDIKIKAVSPRNLPIVDIDLGAFLSNILDNAIEATEKIPDPAQRYIDVDISLAKDYLMCTVMNSIHQPPVRRKGKYQSSNPKSDRKTSMNYHGIGLSNVEDIVRKYNGRIITNVSKTEFKVISSLKIA